MKQFSKRKLAIDASLFSNFASYIYFSVSCNPPEFSQNTLPLTSQKVLDIASPK
jgi:hypothetical protein